MRLKSVTIEPSLKDESGHLDERLLSALPVETVLEEGPSPKLSDYRQGKRHLHLDMKRGRLFHICASLDPRYICCSTHVVAHVSNCPFECTYCFLQNYLTDTTLTLVADTDALLQEIEQAVASQPWRLFRIGTWELGDSLGNRVICQGARRLVEGFARLDNAVLKLRTKGALVEPLLDADHGGRSVISWTVNPRQVIGSEEIATAPLEERIRAMRLAADAGYMIGLHFDPMLLFDGWQDAYRELVFEIFDRLDPSRVCWISMGSLRFNPEMKRKIETNYPRSRITAQEMVLGDDNKLRYVRYQRVEMYRHLLMCLDEAGAGECFTYLCMERSNVWRALFSDPPGSIGELDYRFAEALRRRFPHLKLKAPDLQKYFEAAEIHCQGRKEPD